ncbi:damage-inducible protein J [Alkalimonas collagenimarina]|uniref:Damage-inducible protein J n=1 Tax=Alkalimonas collagenimarina TaxID=400390 RepID=A0ABT9H0V4_9GAMM|nr:damage-inducible protein J [Alkalimonas collagenimarina]MDP4536545.1 damage-inducible protein J [Alkalimonas collagenimarina]
MDTRIQFRMDEDTKCLAQQCQALSHDALLTKQVTQAFEKVDSGKAIFVEHNVAKTRMAERKATIRNRSLA